MSVIESQANLLDKIEDSIDSKILNMEALGRLLNSTKILNGDRSSFIVSITTDSEDVVYLDLNLVDASENTFVLDLDPIDHWIEVNTKPKFVIYSGTS